MKKTAHAGLAVSSRDLSGWGNFPRVRCAVVELKEPFSNLDPFESFVYLTARGQGRSYGDASLAAEGGAVLQTSPNGPIIALDSLQGTITVDAGVTLERVLDVVVPKGWIVPVMPGTRFVSMGGAVAGNIHGKNHHRRGAIGKFVDQITLLTETGRFTCGPTEHRELFLATIGGFGMTGLIQSVKLRLLPLSTSRILARRVRCVDFEQILARLDEEDGRHEYSLAWIDTLAKGRSLGRGIVMFGDHAAVSDLPQLEQKNPLQLKWKREKRVPPSLGKVLLGRWCNHLFNALQYHWGGRSSAESLVEMEPWFFPLDGLRDWNQLYGPPGFLQYQFVIPRDHEPRIAFRKVLERLLKRKIGSFVAGLKTLGNDDVLLPFAREGYTFGIDFGFRDRDIRVLLSELDKIVLDHGGRVCLSKDSRLTAEMFRGMYPEFESWIKVVRQYAPTGRFRSRMSYRLRW
ncbi:MAG: FAD-binding oxidoreductase [Planctomycetota bacterium]